MSLNREKPCGFHAAFLTALGTRRAARSLGQYLPLYIPELQFRYYIASWVNLGERYGESQKTKELHSFISTSRNLVGGPRGDRRNTTGDHKRRSVNLLRID